MSGPIYTYVVVRADLSASQQAVQACHACLEVGKQFPWRGDHPHLVLLVVPDESALQMLRSRLELADLVTVPFYEPDLNNSLTAVAVPGVSSPAQRRLFAHLPVLKLAIMEKVKMLKITESKRGFHPCVWEHYVKLRRLNFLAFIARLRIAAWGRWARKDPANRRRFITGLNGWEGAKKRAIPKMHRAYQSLPEPIRPPIDTQMADTIAADFQNARMPVGVAEVRPLVLSEDKVDNLLNSLEKWFKPADVVSNSLM